MSELTHFKQSKRELRIIVCTWALFCVWVVGYCSIKAYNIDPETLSITFGMPSWVFWGIAAPWFWAMAFTVFFGLRLLKHQPLETDGGGLP